MEFYRQVLKAKKENKAYAIATVVKTEGNTPRSAGAKMLVFADGSIVGSVGGGIVEKQTVADCLKAIQSGVDSLKTYSAISQEIAQKGMVCGNNMTIFIEPGERLPYLYLCGCGHVAQAVLPLAKSMGYYVVAIDARDISGYEEALAPADELHILESFDKIGELDFVPGSAFIACSFSHKTDGDILNVILSKEPSYVGMLGGKPKIRALFTRLKENGYSEEVLKKMPVCEDFAVVSDMFRQLSDASRVRIYWILCHCEECVINLSAMVGMSSPALSHHLRQLKSAGLVVTRREGKEVYYKAADTERAQMLHKMIEAMVSITCPDH